MRKRKRVIHKHKPSRKYDRHHRHPKSQCCSYSGNINGGRNISVVCKQQHRSYHHLFNNMLPDEIAEVLNTVWISPDWKLIAVRREP